MAGKTLDIQHLLNPDNLAGEIANKWQQWVSHRDKWLKEKQELRDYVFATDTTTTSNSKLPWSNKTTVPKITSVYDTLKALYSSALFPNTHYLKWEGDDRDANIKTKRDTIQAYMETKLRQSEFTHTADRLIDDYVLYGNCFATVEWVDEVVELEDGDTAVPYIGPKVVRISPYDIVFNPVASSFEKSPKIIRSLHSFGEIQKMIEAGEEQYKPIFSRMMGNRATVANSGRHEKSQGFIADGFGSIELYYGSDYIELLTFYGDIYDVDRGILLANQEIIIADRSYIISNKKIASWLGRAPIFHSGWRNRPDNLYAMGPLDNLVGLQYRIDHLENLKADVFDMIAFPVLKIKGSVPTFTYEPGTQINLGEDGDVSMLVPETTALQADFQIRELENKMEELAGAPRQAIGIRSPGEKTAFEVSTLDNAANRIFQHKSEKLEMELFQKIFNAMLEAARRNMDVSDTIRVSNDDVGVKVFTQITKEDILGNGKLWPVGASHFAERAKRVQSIMQMLQLKSIPDVGPHLSGQKIAEIIAGELGEPELYGENVAVQEALKTQAAMQDAEADNAGSLAVGAAQGM